MAVIYNDADPHSRKLAALYAERRAIPTKQVRGVTLDRGRPLLSASQFEAILADLEARLPPTIQAYALAWTRPYRVGCMSITSAFAFGYDEKYCARGCQPTAASPYYGSVSTAPYRDHGIRPAMLLGAGSYAATIKLIERGLKADRTHPPDAAAYLVTSRDRVRNTRAPRYPLAAKLFSRRLPVYLLRSEGIAGYDQIMFYFIGGKRIPNLNRIRFAAGAVADHLTSTGGDFNNPAQMSALEWLNAGATGSYGTVVEPCNFPQKFPDPPVMIGHYLNGDTMIEAYWKSVQWPGQGVFVGEPLARPYGRTEAQQ